MLAMKCHPRMAGTPTILKLARKRSDKSVSGRVASDLQLSARALRVVEGALDALLSPQPFVRQKPITSDLRPGAFTRPGAAFCLRHPELIATASNDQSSERRSSPRQAPQRPIKIRKPRAAYPSGEGHGLGRLGRKSYVRRLRRQAFGSANSRAGAR
jgi:hypothetical protein